MTEKQRILSEMWAAGANVRDIAIALGVSTSCVYTLRHQYKLPKRPKVHAEPSDPTPDQIAERARECRERHYARRRSETDDATHSKLWHRNQAAAARYATRRGRSA